MAIVSHSNKNAVEQLYTNKAQKSMNISTIIHGGKYKSLILRVYIDKTWLHY